MRLVKPAKASPHAKFYSLSTGHNYNIYSIRRLRVAYNDAFRMIHCLSRHTRTRFQQIFYNVSHV